MAEETQHINLQLDAHQVSLMVPREAEPIYREAATWLNQRYKRFLQLRPTASAEQLWMYTALEAAVQLKADIREKSLEPVEDELRKLNALISCSLKEEDDRKSDIK